MTSISVGRVRPCDAAAPYARQARAGHRVDHGHRQPFNSGAMGTARGYSESELRAMVQDVESDLVERKESLRGDAPTGIREAVCAFANDLPDHQCPGVVFVGLSDAGRPTGLPITDALLRQLADIKTDGNIVPPPTLTVGTHAVAGHDVAVVTVQPARLPTGPIPGTHLDSRGATTCRGKPAGRTDPQREAAPSRELIRRASGTRRSARRPGSALLRGGSTCRARLTRRRWSRTTAAPSSGSLP